jgi:hypothetical protein
LSHTRDTHLTKLKQNIISKSALFWDITQRKVVILYRRFGTTYRSHLQGSSHIRRILVGFLDLEDGTDILYRNVGIELPLCAV